MKEQVYGCLTTIVAATIVYLIYAFILAYVWNDILCVLWPTIPKVTYFQAYMLNWGVNILLGGRMKKGNND